MYNLPYTGCTIRHMWWSLPFYSREVPIVERWISLLVYTIMHTYHVVWVSICGLMSWISLHKCKWACLEVGSQYDTRPFALRCVELAKHVILWPDTRTQCTGTQGQNLSLSLHFFALQRASPRTWRNVSKLLCHIVNRALVYFDKLATLASGQCSPPCN